jgi:hypothetical protein
MANKWYLKERINPQFDKPYYVKKGQLTKKEAKKCEETLYGINVMIPFETETKYSEKINELKKEGFIING